VTRLTTCYIAGLGSLAHFSDSGDSSNQEEDYESEGGDSDDQDGEEMATIDEQLERRTTGQLTGELVIYKTMPVSRVVCEGIWLSGKTLDCQPRDCEFDSPSLQLKLLKGDMYWFFPGKMLPCISALHWAR